MHSDYYDPQHLGKQPSRAKVKKIMEDLEIALQEVTTLTLTLKRKFCFQVYLKKFSEDTKWILQKGSCRIHYRSKTPYRSSKILDEKGITRGLEVSLTHNLPNNCYIFLFKNEEMFVNGLGHANRIPHLVYLDGPCSSTQKAPNQHYAQYG